MTGRGCAGWVFIRGASSQVSQASGSATFAGRAGLKMSALQKFEAALQEFLDDRNGEHWPCTQFVVYALTTDPETMTLDEPEWIIPEGQRDSMSKMLLTEALDTLKAETAPQVSYVSWEPAEDDDDDD